MATSLAECLAAEEPVELRVGILAYEDFRQDVQQYDRLFAELSREGNSSFRFRLASGTYGDLLHWLSRGSIDIAILTPAVYAEVLTWPTSQPTLPRYKYLASLRLPPVRSKWSAGIRQEERRHDEYRSVCLVPAGSSLRSVSDLAAAAASHRVRLLFVDPLSLSGSLAPRHALAAANIRIDEADCDFTHSHSNSLRALVAPDASQERVAFVWDGAIDDLPELASQVRSLPIEPLDSLLLPTDVLIARNDLARSEELQVLLLNRRPDDFRKVADERQEFANIAAWVQPMVRMQASAMQQVALDDLGAMLLHYGRSQPKPPRLAVVLSGGGAKCSYQVGAVAAVENELSRLRKANGDTGLDIALVVGTSGGAINALPVALGISSTPDGQADFRDVWTQLDQREIVQPAAIVRANIGLWFAIALVLLVCWRTNRVVDLNRRARWESASMILLGLAQLAIGYLPYQPWSLLGTNHVVHHVWLWLTLGVRWSGWCLLTIGVLSLLLRTVLPNVTDRLRGKRRWWMLGCGAALLVLPLGQLITVLMFQPTLSGGTGIEHVLATSFHSLIDQQLKREGKAPLEVRANADGDRLREISRQVVERKLLRRDLVLTGSCLAQTSNSLPSDLYFFASVHGDGTSRPFGARGISLGQYPEQLLDVVMGSGAIYPMFPPRTIDDFPERDQSIDLVDGGFAHNSPIEAAVKWGATHVLLIQASPEERHERSNFVQNVSAAFNHLYAQAQQIDVRSKEQVVIFTLSPSAPHLCVLDFAGNLVEASIEKGFREASRQALFRKELGEPVFWEAGSLNSASAANETRP